MTPTAIALVLASALLHAGWNLFSKSSGDRWAFHLLAGTLTSLLWLPVVVWLDPAIPGPMGALLLLLSILTHAGYLFFLLAAYQAGDLSVAYPLSRTAPILVAVWDIARSQTVRPLGILGVVIAGLGAVVLQWPSLRRGGARATLAAPVTRYALVTAVFIAAFTVIDKAGVREVDTVLYLYGLTIGEALWIPFLMGRGRLHRAGAELRRSASRIAFTAMAGPLSYLLILYALSTAPASYVIGLRQSSIVFGVVLGRLVLGESEGFYRLLGAAVILIGAILIAVAG